MYPNRSSDLSSLVYLANALVSVGFPRKLASDVSKSELDCDYPSFPYLALRWIQTKLADVDSIALAIVCSSWIRLGSLWSALNGRRRGHGHFLRRVPVHFCTGGIWDFETALLAKATEWCRSDILAGAPSNPTDSHKVPLLMGTREDGNNHKDGHQNTRAV